MSSFGGLENLGPDVFMTWDFGSDHWGILTSFGNEVGSENEDVHEFRISLIFDFDTDENRSLIFL